MFLRKNNLLETAKRAEEGDLDAQYGFASHVLREMAADDRDAGVVEKAIDYLKNVAINGGVYGLGALVLGELYFEGIHLAQDYKQAMAWFRTACLIGCTPAYYNIGLCYLHGYGVPQDYAKAFDSLLKGSINSDMCQHRLGDMYRDGIFVERDADFAYQVYVAAYLEALRCKERYGLNTGPYGLVSARLAECHLKGIGAAKDVALANRFFQQASSFLKSESFWLKPEKGDLEDKRLFELVQGSPYPVNGVEVSEGTSSEDITELNLQPAAEIPDLSLIDTSSYSETDYFTVYLASARHLLLEGENRLALYRNLLIIYDNLTCFEDDPSIIEICRKRMLKIEDKLKESESQ